MSHLELTQWGLPEGVLNHYHKKGVTHMFPWQVECLATGDVLGGENLVYSAPTSAGKTLVAEILVAQTVFDKQKKALVILPFVSVVREKMFYFQDMFSSNGVRVEGYMGGHTPSAGFQQVNVGVCTIEKANSLINRLLEEKTLENLGIVVVDELHMLGDPYRGYLLELLLTKLLYMSKVVEGIKLQIVGMSATLPNLNMLAKWLKARLYFTDFRPIPLLERLKCGKEYYNNKLEKAGVFQPPEGESDDDLEDVGHICIETLRNGHSVLIFCPTKNWCENLAFKLAGFFRKLGCSESAQIENTSGWVLRQQLDLERINEVVNHLKMSPVGLDKDLARTVPFGVAYHHAGLTLDERDIIEGSFRNGALRVICATSTLSSGVNLPARRVLIRSPMSHGGVMDLLTYKQMIGRAGRMGKDTEGESILICKPNEKQSCRQLMCGGLKPIESCLGSGRLSASLKRAILEIVASGIATTPDEVDKYASSTFLASCSRGNLQDPLSSCLEFLIENELIRLQTGGSYQPTPLGLACLASSLPPDEGLALFRELERARRCFVLDSDLHIIYQVTPYSVSEQWGKIDWLRVLNMLEELSPSMRRVADLVGVEDRFLVKVVKGTVNLSNPEERSKLSIHRRFYTALALQDLVNEVSLTDVAKKYDCNKGTLQSLQQSAATYAGMVAEFAKRLRWGTIEVIVSQFHERLQFGVQKELCELMKLPSLNGIRARTLFNAGFISLSDIANAEAEAIESALLSSTSFQSKGRIAGETDHEFIQRTRCHTVWVTGKTGLTVKDAAESLIKEARNLLELELGVEAVWGKRDETVPSQTLNKTGALLLRSDSLVQKKDKSILVANSEPNDLLSKSGIRVEESEVFDSEKEVFSEPMFDESLINRENEQYYEKGVNLSKIEVGENLKARDKSFEDLIKNSKGIADNNDIENCRNGNNVTDFNKPEKGFKRTPIENKIGAKGDKVEGVDFLGSVLLDGSSNWSSCEMFEGGKNAKEIEIIPDSEKNTSNEVLNITKTITKVTTENTIDKFMDQLSIVLNNTCEWSKCEPEKEVEIVPDSAVKTNSIKSTKKTNNVYESDSARLLTPTLEKLNPTRHLPARYSIDLFQDSPKPSSTPVSSGKVLTSNVGSPDLFSQSLTFDTQMAYAVDTECVSVEVGAVSSQKSDDVGFFSDSSPAFLAETPTHSAPCVLDSVGESFFVKDIEMREDKKRKASPDTIAGSDESNTEESHSSRRLKFSKRAKRLKHEITVVTLLDSDEEEEIAPTPQSYQSLSIPSPRKRGESFLPRMNNLGNNLEKRIDRNTQEKLHDAEKLTEPASEGLDNKMADTVPVNILDQYSARKDDNTKDSHVADSEKLDFMIDNIADTEPVHILDQYSDRKDDNTKDSHAADCEKLDLKTDNIADTEPVHSILQDSKCANENTTKSDVDANTNLNYVDWETLHLVDVCGNATIFKSFREELKEQNIVGIALGCRKKAKKMTIGANFAKNCGNMADGELLENDDFYFENYVLDGIAFYWNENYVFYLDLCSPVISKEEKLQTLKVLSDYERIIRVCDIRKQIQILEKCTGIQIVGSFEDPQVADWLLSNSDNASDFKGMIAEYIPKAVKFGDLMGHITSRHTPGLSVNAATSPKTRASFEAYLTFHLIQAQLLLLQDNSLDQAFKEVEMPLLSILMEMESTGFKFDAEKLLKINDELKANMLKLESKAHNLAGRSFGLNSYTHVSKIIHRELCISKGILDLKKKQGCSKDELEFLKQKTNHPILDVILTWRKLKSILTKNVHPLLQLLPNSTVYGSCQTLTATGRISMKEPNIQNTPRDFFVRNEEDGSNVLFSLRDMFIPSDGFVLLSADYCQAELRMLTCLSADVALLTTIKTSADVFVSIAASMHKIPENEVTLDHRQNAKETIYGIIYGIGVKTLSQKIQSDNIAAATLLNDFKTKYSGVSNFLEKTVIDCRKKGYVETLAGRRRSLPSINNSNPAIRSEAERRAINTTIQGSVADLVKMAMVKFKKKCLSKENINKGVSLVLHLHDELIYEVRESLLKIIAPLLKDCMEHSWPLLVPFPVKLKAGPSWGQLQTMEDF